MALTAENLFYNLTHHSVVRKAPMILELAGATESNYKLEVESSGSGGSISTIPIITILKKVLILLF